MEAAVRENACVFVPTMGALHEGHFALVRQAAAISRVAAARPRVVVSIFVNPTQFGSSEDLSRYPRTLEADCRGCEEAGADVVFAPSVETVYPPGGVVRTPALPEVATRPGLEDAARPGHFAGVCQVVLRLFELVKSSHAVFGEKDWQQLQVVRAMVRQEKLPIEIVPGPTVREQDGLAMSSRNRFLSAEDRERGLGLIRALKAAQQQKTPDVAERVMREMLVAGGITPDYAVVRDAETLAPRGAGEWDQSRAMRAVIAGRSGTVRLLDNVPFRV